MTTTKEYLDQAMGAMLVHDNDRAIGLLLRASLAYDDEFNNRLSEEYDDVRSHDLPPLEPLKPKKWRSIDVSCPACGAKPGKPCLRMTHGGGANAKPLDPPQPKPGGGYHPRRVERARARN